MSSLSLASPHHIRRPPCLRSLTFAPELVDRILPPPPRLLPITLRAHLISSDSIIRRRPFASSYNLCPSSRIPSRQVGRATLLSNVVHALASLYLARTQGAHIVRQSSCSLHFSPHAIIYPRTYLLAPLYPYSQARFLESPSRAWNECGLASRALVAAASPLFALGVAFKCEASVELNQTALSSVAPASACTRGVPIRYSPNLSNTHAHMHMHMHMYMCMLHVHAHLVTDHRACI